jgi:hypothetical protein
VLGAFHDLALDGAEPALTALYPAASPQTDWDALWPRVVSLAERRRARLSAFVEHEPQTNEVRRSMGLIGGFLTLAADTGLPLRCFELGASAGLNLSWDRFGYSFGEATWGDPSSPLQLDADWSGPPPPRPEVRLLERAGCDRRPSRLDRPEERRRLEAYIWADQADRLQRLRAAMAIAEAERVTVEEADAAEWLVRRVQPAHGATTVVYHSVFWQYPPEPTRARLRSGIEALGRAATEQAPVAWLRMEPPEDDQTRPMEITLTLWPAGTTRVLARVHPHGAQVHWLG